jgi:hypothetical protein
MAGHGKKVVIIRMCGINNKSASARGLPNLKPVLQSAFNEAVYAVSERVIRLFMIISFAEIQDLCIPCKLPFLTALA